MKKILFLLSFVMMAGLASGQCTKSKKACCKKGAKSTAQVQKIDDGKVASITMMADEAAAANENIERRECAKSGKVSYFEKHTCPKSGKVTTEQVSFNAETKKFERVAAATMSADAAPAKQCSKKDAKQCAKKCSKKDMKKCSKDKAASCQGKKAVEKM